MQQTEKISFKSEQGDVLVGYLQFPANQHPSNFALLAHCFSCTKNARAMREIARALNLCGFAVLRFDMTGLGESEGDFGDGGFVSNTSDLYYAYQYLERHYQAPTLLVGHSLGGTAAICASKLMEQVRAIVTIGSPATAEHVTHHFEEQLEEIKSSGKAEVNLGGRPFHISSSFVQSLLEADVEKVLSASRKAILIMHSPQDLTVAIEHAQTLYSQAHHPKSFASLDGADHMLSDKEDAYYAGQLIGTWVSRYLPREEPQNELGKAKAVAVRQDGDGFTTEIMVRHHALVADEPASVGGNDFGPGPYELVSAGLGACTAMTLKMYARRKKWPLETVDVELRHFKDYPADMQAISGEETSGQSTKIDHFERIIKLTGELDDEQQARLMEIADRCPVHRTLESGAKVVTKQTK